MKNLRNIVIAMALCNPIVMNSAQATSIAQRYKGALELHIAASSQFDAHLIEIAKASDASEVYQHSELVARWIPISPDASKKLESTGVVTRSSATGETELLVVLQPYDITTGDVADVWLTRDRMGKPALYFSFNEAGQDKMWDLTHNNIGRELVQTLESVAVSVFKIESSFYDGVVLPSEVTERLSLPTADVAPIYYKIGPVVTTLVKLAGALALALVVIVAIPSFRTFILCHAKTCLLFATVLGAVVGAIWLGVSLTYTPRQLQGDTAIIQRTMSVSIVELVAGLLIGALIGYLYVLIACRLFRSRNAKNKLSGQVAE